MWEKQSVSEESRIGKVVKDIATTKLYSRNPFAILGMNSVATDQQLQRQFQRLQIAAKLGENLWTHESSFHVSGNVEPRDIEEAFQELKDPMCRIVREFFWFWPNPKSQEKEDQGLSLLKNSDYVGVVKFWMKAETQGSGRITATHNIAVLYHIMVLTQSKHIPTTEIKWTFKLSEHHYQELTKRAFSKWLDCLNHEATWDYMKERVGHINDPRLTEWDIDDMRDTIQFAILSIHARLALEAIENEDYEYSKEHLTLIIQSNFPAEVIEAAKVIVLKAVQQKVLAACKEARQEIDESDEDALWRAEELINETECDREFLIEFDDCYDWDPAVESADAVAKVLVNASIAYVNATDDYDSALEFLDRAYNMAQSSECEEEIRENIETARSNKGYHMRSAAIDYANETKDMDGTVVRLQQVLEYASDDELINTINADIKQAQSIKQQEIQAARNNKAFDMRNAAIDYANETDDMDGTIIRLQHALGYASDDKLISTIKADIAQAQSVKQQEIQADRESRLDMLIGDNRVIISPEIISYKGKSIRPQDVIGVCWGISKNYTNGVRTDRSFSVDLRTNGTFLAIECANHFWESDDKVMSRYNQVVDKVWRTVGYRLFSEIIKSVSRGNTVEIGPFRVERRGVWLKTTKMLFFSGDPELVSWGDLRWYGQEGSLWLESTRKSNVRDSMGYKGGWNAHILEAFLNFLKEGNNMSKIQRGEL